MGQYVKLNLGMRKSDSSDYDVGLDPGGFANTFGLTSKKTAEYTDLAPTTAGITITPPASWTAINACIVVNDGATYPVRVMAYTQVATKTFTAGTLTFNNANPDTIVDSGNLFLSSLFMRRGMFAIVSGTTSAGNTGTFCVQVAAAGTLTLATADTLTDATPEALGPTIISASESHQVIAVSGGMCMLGTLVAGQAITLYGVGGTGSDVTVILIGA